MSTLADVALIGLEQAGAPPVEDPPFVSQLPELAAGGQVLLRLGVAAVRARAGWRAPRAERPQPAPPQSGPFCSPRLAALIIELCQERALPLLGEALAAMDRRGLRLPAQAVVELVLAPAPGLQPVASRVAGERGQWMATQHPDWAWLTAAPAAPERAFEVGSLPERRAALRALRAADPQAARALLEGAWPREKAEVKGALVGELSEGLGPADEPFLEKARTDRASAVRAAAVELLARLPSALATRLWSRASACLADDFTVTPAFDPEDGLDEGDGSRAHWLRQLVAHVPPERWNERFSTESLLAGVRASEWWPDLFLGWVRAARAFGSRPWSNALLRIDPGDSKLLRTARWVPLAGADDQVAAQVLRERIARERLTAPELEVILRFDLGVEVARVFLSVAPASLPALRQVALRLPAACLAEAAVLARSLDPAQRFDELHAVLAARQLIHEETRP